jgi:hypothetical protein
MTPQNARKTRSFKIRKRRIAHSFPLTAFKIIISIIFMQLQSVKCLTNIKGKESVEELFMLLLTEELVRDLLYRSKRSLSFIGSVEEST